jgi:hypothetical protein
MRVTGTGIFFSLFFEEESSRSFIPPPCFIHSRRVTTLLSPSLVLSPLRSA